MLMEMVWEMDRTKRKEAPHMMTVRLKSLGRSLKLQVRDEENDNGCIAYTVTPVLRHVMNCLVRAY